MAVALRNIWRAVERRSMRSILVGPHKGTVAGAKRTRTTRSLPERSRFGPYGRWGHFHASDSTTSQQSSIC